jgi:hypothetical protein
LHAFYLPQVHGCPAAFSTTNKYRPSALPSSFCVHFQLSVACSWFSLGLTAAKVSNGFNPCPVTKPLSHRAKIDGYFATALILVSKAA